MGILDDLSEVMADCYKIGTCLHLKQSYLDGIKRKNIDFVEAMTEIIRNWLKLNYNYQRFGKPTWKALVDAVKSPNGGNNTALAEKIAKRHRGECISVIRPTPKTYVAVTGRKRTLV